MPVLLLWLMFLKARGASFFLDKKLTGNGRVSKRGGENLRLLPAPQSAQRWQTTTKAAFF